MPGSRIEPPPRTERRMPPQRQIDVDRMRVRDPADEVERSLRHLLDNRIDVDGMMVLRRGRVVLDYRRTGFDPASPRLLLEATHPVLAMMVVKASAEGKVDRSKGVDRVLPELGGNTGLGKLSLTPAAARPDGARVDARGARTMASGGRVDARRPARCPGLADGPEPLAAQAGARR
jgi:hypothetical protein